MVHFGPPPGSHEAVSLAELTDRLTHYVSKSDLNQRLTAVERHIRAIEHTITNQGEKIMASQADIDAVTAALAQEDSDLNTAVANLTAADTAIQGEIAALQAANPALDLSGLQAELANSGAAASAVAAAVAATAALVPPAGG